MKIPRRARGQYLQDPHNVEAESHVAPPMLPREEMRVLDRNLESFGFSIEALMDRAGQVVAEVVEGAFPDAPRIVVAAGSGNNGGDGFAAARYLEPRHRVTVVLAKPRDAIAKGPARTAFNRLPRDVAVVVTPPEPRRILMEADVIIDALLGTGLSGELRQPYRSIVEAINAVGKPVVSIDIPSGLGSDRAVKPTITVALHAPKEGMDEANSGRIVVKDIGIPAEAEELVGPGELLLYPVPKEGSHKGDNGRVLIVGGGPFTGAPVLSALGAYAIGADIAHVAVPSHIFQVVASFDPSFIVHGLPGRDILRKGDVPVIMGLLEHADVLALGPGLGREPETMAAARDAIRHSPKAMVIDADALKAAGEELDCLRGKVGVVTPHHGEFEALTGERVPEDLGEAKEVVRGQAKRLGLTFLVKGRVDIVSDGQRTKVVRGGNPGMTVGGTGDVLTGVVAGLMAKGARPFDAARMGAFTNKMAGEFAFREKSYGLTARDVAAKVPQVLVEFLEPRRPTPPLAEKGAPST